MPDISDTAYSEVDASNNQAPPNGWPEGMMPASVNDTARSDRGALKRFWNRVNGVRTTTGAPPYYSITTDNVTYPTAYVSGEIWAFKAHRASGGGDVFQINSLGPKNIYHLSPSVAQIGDGEIPAGQVAVVAYDETLSAGAGGWQLLASGAADRVAKAGDTMSGPLVITATGTALNATNGAISVAGPSTFGGTLAVNGTLTLSSGGTALNVTNGAISVAGASTFGDTLTVNGVLIAHGGGTAFSAPFGNIVTAGAIIANSGQISTSLVVNGGSTPLTVPAGNLSVGGTGFKPGGGPWDAPSDSLLKKNVAAFTRSTADLLKLNPVTYQYNGRGGMPDDGRVFVGLVADDVLPYMPEMVGSMEEKLDPGDAAPTAIQTINTNALLFAMLNSIKALSARIDELESPSG